MASGREPAAGAPEGAEREELPRDVCRQIREFAKLLPELNYYEVLGVERDAGAEEIRDGFFERSKRFHPDRHYRRNLGAHGEILHEIYKRIAVAHEVLRDPDLRAQYDRTLHSAEAAASAATAPPAAGRAESQTSRPAARKRRRSSLRERPSRPFALQALKRQIDLGQRKAARLFEQAQEHQARGEWDRAAHVLHLALAHAPRNREYNDALAEVVPRANEERAAGALQKGQLLLERGAHEEALGFLQEAAELRPMDAALADQVARLLLRAKRDPARARLFGERAVQLDASSPAYQKTLGRACKACELSEEARRAFERVIALDPNDKEAKAELALL